MRVPRGRRGGSVAPQRELGVLPGPVDLQPRPDDPRVVVLVTPGCHLCETAVATVTEVCRDAGIHWVARDLAELPDAHRAPYRDFVPVVLVDGAVHDMLRVDRGRLVADLAARRG